MKFNMNTFKMLIAFTIIIGVIFFAIDSIRSRSYSGENLTFSVSSGSVNITNPSEESIPVQLTGTGFSLFRMVSTIQDVSGSSVREGNGSNAVQLFEFDLPPGTHEFSVTRGTDVNFVASTSTRLEATVDSVTTATRQTIIIATIVVIVGALFYVSHVTDHYLIKLMSNKSNTIKPLEPIAESAEGRQGRAAKSYGDNRTKP